MDTRELKERLGVRARDIIATGLNQKLNRQGKMICPFHNDTHPSISWYEQGLTFKCMVCHETLDIFRYYTDFENMTFYEAKSKVAEMLGVELAQKAERREYTKPIAEHGKLTNTIADYFRTRGINRKVLEDWKIESDMRSGSEWIVFKHFNAQGKLMLNAYREVKTKAFERQQGNREILFGMDRIDTTKPVIITEGHIDALSVAMVYPNVVSVPSGITATAWIENCWAFLDKVDLFIFWADNDGKNGIAEANNIRARIGKQKCIVDYHPKYKDANDLLVKEGVEALSDFVDDMLSQKVEGLTNMGRRRTEEKSIDKFKCGFDDIDRHLKGIEYGCLSIIFGRDNEGKSTFISQMIAELLKRQSVFLYSGELSENKIEDWIMTQIVAGDETHIRRYVDEWGDEETEIKENARQAICKWYRDKFFVYEQKMEASVSSGLFSIMEKAFKVYGVRVFFVDNMMCAVDESTDETTRAENSFIKELKRFAVTYNSHVFLVAHPNKQGSIEHQPLNKVDVNGSKGITNLADYVFGVERSWNPEDGSLNPMYRKEVEGERGKYYTSIVRILKNRAKKPRKDIFYRFHGGSLRFYNEAVTKLFTGDWKKYLKPEPKTVVYHNGETQTFNKGEL